MTGERGERDEPVIELANEFTEVVVERVRTRNGARLRISVPSSGREILLCPLELEALTWQDHELFSRLLETPHGPEDQSPGNDAPGNGDPGNGGARIGDPGDGDSGNGASGNGASAAHGDSGNDAPAAQPARGAD
jgi:hypothetical protein